MCVLFITLYSFMLWYYNKVPLFYSLKELNKMKCQVTLWILGVFQTLSTIRIEAIAGLISIHLHLKKLSSHDQLWMATLSHNYAIKSLLKERYTSFSNHHWLLLENMTSKQWMNIKSSVRNFNSCRYYFYEADYHSDKSKRAHYHKLNEVVFDTSNESNTVIIISDASIKNNVTTSITHVHFFN